MGRARIRPTAIASRNAAVSAAIVRPRPVRLQVAQRDTSAGTATSPSVPRNSPLSPSTPKRGTNALVKPSPSVAPVPSVQNPATATRRRARGLEHDRRPRTSAGRTTAAPRARSRPARRPSSAPITSVVEVAQDRLLLGELAPDDAAARPRAGRRRARRRRGRTRSSPHAATRPARSAAAPRDAATSRPSRAPAPPAALRPSARPSRSNSRIRTRAGCPSTRNRFAFTSWTGRASCGTVVDPIS